MYSPGGPLGPDSPDSGYSDKCYSYRHALYYSVSEHGSTNDVKHIKYILNMLYSKYMIAYR